VTRILLLFIALAAVAPVQVATADELETHVAASIATILDRFEVDDDAARATMDMREIDEVVAFYGRPRRPAVFRDAELAHRMIEQLGACERDVRQRLLPWLRANEAVAASVAFLVHANEDPGPTYALLDQMHEQHGDLVTRRPNLTAAIVVVHDHALTQRVNENRGIAPDAGALLQYFLANEDHLLYPLEKMPAELLVYVVDAAASIDELKWALRRYRGDRKVGERFFDVEYDMDHFRFGRPKKVNAAGWSLPNILEHGGICADQAYFAQTVGKAIGVPTTYTRGASGEGHHAWVGFLETNARHAWWNFDSGRYDAYQGVNGVVRNPQTRRNVTDSEVALLATLVRVETTDRQTAEAMCATAARLLDLEGLGGAPASPVDGLEPRRSADLEAGLDLLEAGLRLNPGLPEGWALLGSLAADGRLTIEHKKRWAGVLHRLCGRIAPDFSLRVLAPMIDSVEDVEDRNQFWDAAFAQYSHRADLAAWIRFSQGAMWLDEGEPERAGKCFEDVINRYANAGPFVIRALEGAATILRAQGDGRRLIALHQATWQRTERPRASAFAAQSNWYRVGVRFAKVLDEAGRTSEADAVRAELGPFVAARPR
jgi:hypothetical protein